MKIVYLDGYPRRITLSNSARARYFKWDGFDIKSKSKPLFKRLIRDRAKADALGRITPDNLLLPNKIALFKKGSKLPVIVFTGEESDILYSHRILNDPKYQFLVFDTLMGQPVLANPSKAGLPHKSPINYQLLYSQYGGPFFRKKLMSTLHKFIASKLKEQGVINPLSTPISIHYLLKDTVNDVYDKSNGRWDIFNRVALYMKAFPDVLQQEGLLEDDDRTRLIGESYGFQPIEDESKRTIEIKILEQHESEFWTELKQP